MITKRNESTFIKQSFPRGTQSFLSACDRVELLGKSKARSLYSLLPSPPMGEATAFEISTFEKTYCGSLAFMLAVAQQLSIVPHCRLPSAFP